MGAQLMETCLVNIMVNRVIKKSPKCMFLSPFYPMGLQLGGILGKTWLNPSLEQSDRWPGSRTAYPNPACNASALVSHMLSDLVPFPFSLRPSFLPSSFSFFLPSFSPSFLEIRTPLTGMYSTGEMNACQDNGPIC